MNFVGHIHVATSCLERHGFPASMAEHHGDHRADEPGAVDRYLFGTALPDFATIARVQLRHQPEDQALAAGVDMHHATDSAFHSNHWFLTNSQRLSTELTERGLNRGATRACAHVGVELLLDGHLLAHTPALGRRTQSLLELADDRILGLDRLVGEDDQNEWRRQLRRITTWRLPADYDQPAAVATRLFHILRNRRRLAFESDQIDQVAAGLTAVEEELSGGIDDMVASMTKELSGTIAGGGLG